MSMEQCKICKGWKFDWKEHKCPHVFEILHEEYNGDDIIEQRAWSHEDAATEYAEEYDSNGDYCLMDEYETIKVRKQGEEEYKTFEIHAEADVHYSTTEKD